MLRLIARFLLLVAVLAAPLGMTAAPAAPAHHGAATSMSMAHCADQQQPAPEKESGIADCAMACAAALPALAGAAADQTIAPGTLEPPARASLLSGRHLEIATPPPKVS